MLSCRLYGGWPRCLFETTVMELTDRDRCRYARHIAMPDFGEQGQLRLKQGSVMVIGAGGLGSPVALYLAASGVGTIGIADGDCVDESNLQRQVIHSTRDIGVLKVLSARNKMLAINPDANVVAEERFVTADNISEIIEPYDFVIDATDSLDIKFLVDDVCVALGKPYNHGAIWQYEGQTMTVLPGTSSYRTLFPDGPVAVGTLPASGPLGVVPGILGTIQAAEAIKYLAGVGTLLTDRLLRFNALTMKFVEIRLR